MKYNDIKDVFAAHLKIDKYDKLLYDKIREYRLQWVNKDEMYSQFLGGNLLGVHPIRFSSVDEEIFFIDILNIDFNLLKEDLHNLNGINKNWSVSSNPFYLTVCYLMHKFATSKDIGKYRDDAIRELYYIFAYKAISSLIAWYFSYELDIPTAKAAYERLSNRFLIKKLGSWQAVFTEKSKDVLPNGIRWKNIVRYNTEDAVLVVSDLQSRIRDLVKNIFKVIMDVKTANERINSSSMIGTIGEDDQKGIVDQIERPDLYYKYILSIISSQADFVNDDYIYLVSKITNLKQPDRLTEVLIYISNNYLNKKIDTKFIEISINNTIKYLITKNITHDYKKHIYEILLHMKGYWSSSSVKDKDALEAKKYVKKITKLATGIKTEWVISNIAISVLLYVFLRSVIR